MTTLLRIILIVASAATTWKILRKIRTSKMRIEDSIFWIGFSFLLLLISLFPRLVYFLTDFTGIQAPVNFIFLFMIFVLILRVFRLTVKLSQLEAKMRTLVQYIAIEEKLQNEKEGQNCPLKESRREEEQAESHGMET